MKAIYSLLFAASLVLPAHAVTFVNGSFEDLTASYVNIPDADRMNAVAADGWTVLLNSPDWFWGEGPANLWNTPFGDHFAIGAATGLTGSAYREGISQTVSGFTIGNSYSIAFSHANGLYFNPGSPGFYEGVGTAGGWEVLVDGTSILQTSSTNDHSTAALEHTSDWQSSSANFTATAATHTIQFVAFKPDGPQTPTFQFLDEASVTLVPEPSRAILSLLGVAAIGLRRRRS